MKTCFKCKRALPRSEFYAHRMMADGLLGKCKECARLDVAEARARRRAHYLAYDRERTVGLRRRRWAHTSAKWVQKFPDRRSAQTAVSNAIRDGRLVRPCACSLCGETTRLHGHHDDYSRSLDVRWLCVPCHKSWHAKLEGKTPWRLIRLGIAS